MGGFIFRAPIRRYYNPLISERLKYIWRRIYNLRRALCVKNCEKMKIFRRGKVLK